MNVPQVAVYSSDEIIQSGLAAIVKKCPHLALVAIEGASTVVVAVETADPAALDLLRQLPAPGDARFVLLARDGWRMDPGAAAQCRLRGLLIRANLDADALIRVVLAVSAGQALLPPAVQGQLLDQVEQVHRNVLAPRGITASGLTVREVTVLRLMSEGLEVAEIALLMSYSERTIKKILSAVLSRFGLRNRTQAVSYAIRLGVI
jgi:DNA-binding NarL/FixJ family response regulator